MIGEGRGSSSWAARIQAGSFLGDMAKREGDARQRAGVGLD